MRFHAHGRAKVSNCPYWPATISSIQTVGDEETRKKLRKSLERELKKPANERRRMLLLHWFQTGDYSFVKSDSVKAFVPGQASNLPPSPQPNPHIPISLPHLPRIRRR